MTKLAGHRGAVNGIYLMLVGAMLVLIVLGVILLKMGGTAPGSAEATGELVMYCAAGVRLPIEQIVANYQRETGVAVQILFGGSNTLLSQMEVARSGDLFLAADEHYLNLARENELIVETFPLAAIRPVIAVRKGNPKQIRGLDDLLRDDVITALANADQAAIGRTTRELLQASGQWDSLAKRVTDRGVFQPTVTELANTIKLGAADAAIVWDTTVTAFADLEAIRVPVLDAGVTPVALGVLATSQDPAAARRFARYVAASDKGLVVFRRHGYQVVVGEEWSGADTAAVPDQKPETKD